MPAPFKGGRIPASQEAVFALYLSAAAADNRLLSLASCVLSGLEPVWSPIHQISRRAAAKSKSAASFRKAGEKSAPKSNHAARRKPSASRLAPQLKGGDSLPYVTPAAGERWGNNNRQTSLRNLVRADNFTAAGVIFA